jgi:hypothetical protein
MTQQIINIGTTANDKHGDPIRTAFTKVNQNFTELYSAIIIPSQTNQSGKYLKTNGTSLTWSDGPSLGYITFNQNTITGENSYLTLGPDGVLLTQTGGNIDLLVSNPGNNKLFSFTEAGSLRFPDGSEQTTAFKDIALEIDGGNASTNYVN